MNIRITGLNGYIGQLIASELRKKGHNPLGVKRELLYGDTSKLREVLRGGDIVINLAGAPILQYWTEKNKQIIYDSRVLTTRNLVRAVKELPENERPNKIISASAVGIYAAGSHHNEQSNDLDKGFVGHVVNDWEQALSELPGNVQKVVFRIGLVLGKEAKTVKSILLPFKLGLGGKIGSGKQPFPFIHENDVARAFVWAVEEYEKSDTFNLTATENISNKEFTKTFARVLKRPAFLTIPPFALKALYGQASSLLLESPSVSSDKLLLSGFNFSYPTIESTLKEII